MSTLTRIVSVLGVLLTGASITRSAEPGLPVGVRWWGEETVSVESAWNLRVSISATTENAREADLSVIVGKLPTDLGHSVVTAVGADLDVSLDRPVNSADVSIEATESATVSPNTVRVRSFEGDALWVLVQCDGVSILYTNDEGAQSVPGEVTSEIDAIDVLVLPIGVENPGALISAASARKVVPIGFRSPKSRDFKAFEERIDSAASRRDAVGNTTAVSTEIPSGSAGLDVLKARPWRARGKLVSLLKSIDRKNRKSQETFAPLSANQMNHKPANGTHAPRWNVEHMAGTELAFFTSVYSNVSADIPVVQRFPAQQPPDYVPANPEYDGAEEARQMERILALRNRFAYLLDGLDLETLPRGAPRFTGSLEGMCERVGDHYDEHTAHVHKKFKLDDWPEE